MTLFLVARPVAFKVPRGPGRFRPPFALTVVIALSLTSATGVRHAVVSRANRKEPNSFMFADDTDDGEGKRCAVDRHCIPSMPVIY